MPANYHVIAPDLPGYHQSEPLKDNSDYQVTSLVSRMGEFVQTVSQGRKAILVGHDWGGAIAWPLAAFQPNLFTKLVILNAAHPSTFTQALKTSRAQRKKSEYIKSLVADDAEAVLKQTDFALLKGMLGSALFDGDMPKNAMSKSAMPKNKDHKAKHGLYRALINNMVSGVSTGWTKELELVGVGYRASNQGQKLDLALGFSHNIVLEVVPEVKVETISEKGKNPIVKLTSIDKQLIGQVAAKIRGFRTPEPYKGKGVRFVGEQVRRKAGKSA